MECEPQGLSKTRTRPAAACARPDRQSPLDSVASLEPRMEASAVKGQHSSIFLQSSSTGRRPPVGSLGTKASRRDRMIGSSPCWPSPPGRSRVPRVTCCAAYDREGRCPPVRLRRTPSGPSTRSQTPKPAADKLMKNFQLDHSPLARWPSLNGWVFWGRRRLFPQQTHHRPTNMYRNDDHSTERTVSAAGCAEKAQLHEVMRELQVCTPACTRQYTASVARSPAARQDAQASHPSPPRRASRAPRGRVQPD